MKYQQLSPDWSYKTISDTTISMYHVVFTKVPLDEIRRDIVGAKYIEKKDDGSLVIELYDQYTPETLRKILAILDEKASQFLEVPNFYYYVDKPTRDILKEWFLAFQGCLAFLLSEHPGIKHLLSDWQFINSYAGGIYLNPFTLFLYSDHPKIIHPVTVRNYDERSMIENITAATIRAMVGRLKEAQPGYEGMALLSMVKDKTNLDQKEIVKRINDKCYGIVTPKHSPFFS